MNSIHIYQSITWSQINAKKTLCWGYRVHLVVLLFYCSFHRETIKVHVQIKCANRNLQQTSNKPSQRRAQTAPLVVLGRAIGAYERILGSPRVISLDWKLVSLSLMKHCKTCVAHIGSVAYFFVEVKETNVMKQMHTQPSLLSLFSLSFQPFHLK